MRTLLWLAVLLLVGRVEAAELPFDPSFNKANVITPVFLSRGYGTAYNYDPLAVERYVRSILIPTGEVGTIQPRGATGPIVRWAVFTDARTCVGRCHTVQLYAGDTFRVIFWNGSSVAVEFRRGSFFVVSGSEISVIGGAPAPVSPDILQPGPAESDADKCSRGLVKYCEEGRG